jgi:hypothetical protein
MSFKPWTQHELKDGVCAKCGLPLPYADAVFSHSYVDGRVVFSPKPAGRTELCHTEKLS